MKPVFISTEHSPPKIVCGAQSKPQAVTSPRSSNVTVIAGANALGHYIPPFYIFPGKRWQSEFLSGASTGADGLMSETGWSNSGTFETYITKHLTKYASLDADRDRPVTLILYDGHKSHINLTLTKWAKERNVILYVLPPHTSHLTQPLDVGVFGPFKNLYYRECQRYMHENPGMSVTKYEVASLTSRPYTKALCPSNIISAFRKSGVYPLNRSNIDSVQTAPAAIYATSESPEQLQVPSIADAAETVDQDLPTEQAHMSAPETTACNFFDKRTIKTVVQKKKRKFTPPFKFTGDLTKQSNIDELKEISAAKKQKLEKKHKCLHLVPPGSNRHQRQALVPPGSNRHQSQPLVPPGSNRLQSQPLVPPGSNRLQCLHKESQGLNQICQLLYQVPLGSQQKSPISYKYPLKFPQIVTLLTL